MKTEHVMMMRGADAAVQEDAASLTDVCVSWHLLLCSSLVHNVKFNNHRG